MKALILYGPGDLRLEDVKEPEPPSGWALVKTEAVGICGTDKAFYKGTYPLFKKPLIPGHEVAGRVVSDGPLKGSRVVSEINFSCGKCEYCRRGLYTHCPYKKTLGIDFDGGFAEYFVAPLEALHRIDGLLDPVTATEVEPLAAVLNAFTQAPPKPTDNVAVIGTGNIALLTVHVLRWLGLEPVVVARSGSSKAHYFAEQGFRVLVDDEVFSYIREKTPEGLGFDVVVEASGSPEALDKAISLTRPRGVIHLKSTPGSQFKVGMTLAVVKELRIIGTRCGTFREFRRAIELLSKGVVKPAITKIFDGLDNAVKAFEASLRPEEFKVVVRNTS
ncbi:MAG: MDR/zinc-dependent alcohol dehydrogenase-like family protein [Infirmifilum sp.]|uniref:MDR/zinc-dependent alcohol dehydrogenase-like family protein n=1 Tax=Infirmifilum TaxID=2856573 RepID=UPI0023525386